MTTDRVAEARYNRYAAALKVVEAARASNHRPCEDEQCLFRTFGDDQPHRHSCCVCRSLWPCPTAVALAVLDAVGEP